jgi:hypothetical protein
VPRRRGEHFGYRRVERSPPLHYGIYKSNMHQELRQVSSGDTDVVSFKTETLEQAGINLRTAERYEELTGGRES